jgi:hypothetical protein
MPEGSNKEASVVLDKESFERLERLKAIIVNLDDGALIALALKGLEEKADRIIRRRVKKRAFALKNEGLSPKQIAKHLNKKGFPPIEGGNKWHSEGISMLLKE